MTKHQILIVDDDKDIHDLTRLSLKGMSFKGQGCEFLSAYSAADALSILQGNLSISVVLLDVVMESDLAGLNLCRHIREEQSNDKVRIILRTGQPGNCPKKETIDAYDLDGYLSKTEITATKLYSAVRTGMKAWYELMELERHRQNLTLIHECAMSIHSYEPLEMALPRIMSAAASICSTSPIVLNLQTTSGGAEKKSHTLHRSNMHDDFHLNEYSDNCRQEINSLVEFYKESTLLDACDGVVFPFALHREIGRGWIYVATTELDNLQQQALYLLCGHASNMLYSMVAKETLPTSSDGDDFDLMSI